MNDYVDKKIKLMTDSGKSMEGIVAGHTDSFVLLKIASEKPAVRIPKRKIEFFQPTEEEVVDSNLKNSNSKTASSDSKPSFINNMKVLACENEKNACKGVKFIKLLSDEPSDSDYEEMTFHCTKKNKNCKMGCLGNLGEVNPKILSNLLDQTLYGEYPE